MVTPSASVVGQSIPLGAGSVFDVTLGLFEGRQAVVKEVRPGLRDSALARLALDRECAALALLDGRHAPALLRVETDAENQRIRVWQERARGRSLRAIIAAEGPLASAELDRVMGCVFEALAAVHAARDARGSWNLCHGDLQPDHVFLEGDRVTFIDFGMARFRGLAVTSAMSNERGTLPFCAPDVLRGEAAPDQSSDVYALAAVMLYAALGYEPGEGPPSSVRLVTLAERGLGVDVVDSCMGLSDAAYATLTATLAFQHTMRINRAVDVLALLSR